MNWKKANWLYLTFILMQFGLSFLLSWYYYVIHGELGMAYQMLLSEGVFLIPALSLLLFTKTRPRSFLKLKGFRVQTFFKIILYTVLAFPVTAFLNSLTLLFTDNAVMEVSGDILTLPFLISFLLIAVYAPFVEEFAFRGMLFQSYRGKNPGIFSVLLSSFLFGLAHMNLNQFVYAFGLGIFMAFLVEATGSIFSSMIFHAIINGYTVVNLYLSKDSLLSQDFLNAQEEIMGNKEIMLATVSTLGVVALICLFLAGAVLYWISEGEGRTQNLKELVKINKKERLLSLPLILAILIGISYLVLLLI